MSNTQILRPTLKDAEQAYKIILQFVGEDIEREGLEETPKRAAKALNEWFSGYKVDPHSVLSTTFSEVEGYQEMVMLRNIRLESHCEHHMCPIIGKVHIAYLPNKRVVGISKLARVVEAYGKRFQIQERLNQQIAQTIYEVLEARGVAVMVEAQHFCIGTRGIHKHESDMVTTTMLGEYQTDAKLREEFYRMVNK
jgi:GTP cyclohydrolase I